MSASSQLIERIEDSPQRVNLLRLEIQSIKTSCPECGSEEVVRNIPMAQAVEAGYAGLKYKAVSIFY